MSGRVKTTAKRIDGVVYVQMPEDKDKCAAGGWLQKGHRLVHPTTDIQMRVIDTDFSNGTVWLTRLDGKITGPYSVPISAVIYILLHEYIGGSMSTTFVNGDVILTEEGSVFVKMSGQYYNMSSKGEMRGRKSLKSTYGCLQKIGSLAGTGDMWKTASKK